MAAPKKREANVVDWDTNPKIRRVVIEAVRLHRQAKKPGAKGGSRQHWHKTEAELLQKYAIVVPHETLKAHSKVIQNWMTDPAIAGQRTFFLCQCHFVQNMIPPSTVKAYLSSIHTCR